MYLSPYQKHWPQLYLAEEARLFKAYDGEVSFHHIGSTAVKGLYAKNCIDILAVVPKLAAVSSCVSAITGLGYEYRGHYGVEGREYFAQKRPKVHLHFFQEGHPAIVENLGFVKLMRNSELLCNELNDLKLALFKKYPTDKEAYQRDKKAFYDALHERIAKEGVSV